MCAGCAAASMRSWIAPDDQNATTTEKEAQAIFAVE